MANGAETDVDCGGTCSGCALGQACLVGADCASKSCEVGLCVAPTCADQIANGDESDVDCGGTTCPPCADGQGCALGSDCTSQICTGGVCQIPTCSDGVKNGAETDLDCGGPCPAKCALGLVCLLAGDCVTATCTAGACECPAKMVKVPKVGQGAFCIDQTEITYHDYSDWLDTSPPKGAQPLVCTWNQSFVPQSGWPPPFGHEGFPVTYVDWCDAVAYCSGVGKHLCGKTDGGSSPFDAFADAASSEWYDACSLQGSLVFPYGDAFQPAACNDAANPNGTPPTEPYQVKDPANGYAVVATSCEGGQPGLYEMSGNLAEWEDSCDNVNDVCRVRGGSWATPEFAAACDADAAIPRGGAWPAIGFRCCL